MTTAGPGGAALFFGCWDRPDLRPEAYGQAPSPAIASAPARLAAEQSRRNALYEAAVRRAKDLEQAVFAVRRFDQTGNADMALDHLLATEGQLRVQLRLLVDAVELAYSGISDDGAPDGPLSDPVPAPEPVSVPVQAPAPVSAPPAGPSPADVARFADRRSA